MEVGFEVVRNGERFRVLDKSFEESIQRSGKESTGPEVCFSVVVFASIFTGLRNCMGVFGWWVLGMLHVLLNTIYLFVILTWLWVDASLHIFAITFSL